MGSLVMIYICIDTLKTIKLHGTDYMLGFHNHMMVCKSSHFFQDMFMDEQDFILVCIISLDFKPTLNCTISSCYHSRTKTNWNYFQVLTDKKHSTHNQCWISELDQTIRHTTSVEYPSWTKLWVPSLDRTITKAADLCDSILFDFRIWKTSYQCFIWIFQKNEFYNLVNDYNL